MLVKNKKLASVVVVLILVATVLWLFWIWPMIGNYFSNREIRCIDCFTITNYGFQYGEEMLFFREYDNDEIGTFSSGMLQEALLNARANFPSMCTNCTYLVEKILTLPNDSVEWQYAWDTYHRIRR